jgi:polysaccharide biosynthesis transport protein
MNAPQPQEDSNPLIRKLLITLRRQWLPATIVFLCIFGFSAYWTSRQKRIYEANGEIIFKTDRSARLTGIGPDAEQTGNNGNSGYEGSRLKTEAQVLRSGNVIDRTIKSLGFPLTRNDFLRDVQVEILSQTNVLKVTYRSYSAEQAAAVVNGLMNSYIEKDLQANREESVVARKFIDSQLPQVEKELTKSEFELRNFKEKNKITSLQAGTTASMSAIAELEQQITSVKAQISNLEASSADLRKRLGINSDRAKLLSKLNGSDSVKQALSEHQKVEGQLAIMRTQYQSDHPAVKRLQRQQETLQSILKARIAEVAGSENPIPLSDLQLGGLEISIVNDLVKSETSTSGLREQLATLTNSLSEYTSRLQAIPKLEQEQQILERNLAINRSTYEGLLKKTQEIRLAENQKVGNARILSPSIVPTEPISPRVVTNLISGGLFGLVLAVATALFLQSMDTMLRTTEEVKRIFGYNLLGVLPSFGKKSQDMSGVFVRANPRSPISEAYRMLQTKLRFLRYSPPVKVIVVTSSIPAEGKSTVAANLAAVSAQLGKRTLIIDADMRRPSQQLIWKLTNGLGLSDLLTGKTSRESAIQHVMPNLSLLLTGALPSNPLSLLDSKRMTDLIQDATETYDYIIIDAPPILAVADAMILGNLAHGLLLITRPELLNSADATRAKVLLEQSGIDVLGLVVNGATSDDKVYYKYNSYYSDVEEPSSTPIVGYGQYKQSEFKK